jgi:hypothetical protein
LVRGEGKLEYGAWIPIYINGRSGFEKAVQSKLRDSWLQGTPEVGNTLIMYWLHQDSELHKFKLAIGSKIIFKYRLHFFMNLNEYVTSDGKLDGGLSLDEDSMIQKMIMWEIGRPTQNKQKQLES